jgi:hypothetical protein
MQLYRSLIALQRQNSQIQIHSCVCFKNILQTISSCDGIKAWKVWKI